MKDISIIGGGPAGLIAAERLAEAGLKVTVYDRMPSLGRKFLMAGRGGLNLTHSEPLDSFLARYSDAPHIHAAIRTFPPATLRAWAEELGEETFVGSSGRVFPKSFKASPLLRAWLRRLDGLGVAFRTRHAWRGWSDNGALVFDTPEGRTEAHSGTTLLALGGASWPKLGSDGGWAAILAEKGVAIAALAPANSGVRVEWSETFRERFAGQPVKRIRLSAGASTALGELMVTRSGLEGGAVYALSAAIRAALAGSDPVLSIDMKPDLDLAEVTSRLSRPRKGETTSNFLRKALALAPVQIGLLREAAGRDLPGDPAALAALTKAATLRVAGTMGLDRAISTAGGVMFSEVDEHLMLRALPGVFVAGEMLDWEAPTGGYLLQACFATGMAAANGILKRVTAS